eukprot:9125374-Alexandrium_andersonii.AAC.1
MSASLVGSEMCIRDRPPLTPHRRIRISPLRMLPGLSPPTSRLLLSRSGACLLYTSDAADDM